MSSTASGRFCASAIDGISSSDRVKIAALLVICNACLLQETRRSGGIFLKDLITPVLLNSCDESVCVLRRELPVFFHHRVEHLAPRPHRFGGQERERRVDEVQQR